MSVDFISCEIRRNAVPLKGFLSDKSFIEKRHNALKRIDDVMVGPGRLAK